MKFVIYVFSLVVIAMSSSAYGITGQILNDGEQIEVTVVTETNGNKILLLSWQGDYLRTTSGTIYAGDVVVNNSSGLDKDEINQTNSAPEVILTESGNKIVKVDIVAAE